MKQFILADTFTTEVSSSKPITKAGQLYVNNETGADFLQLIAGRGVNVVPDSFVVYKKNLRYTVTKNASGVAFEAKVTIPAVASGYNYHEAFVVISKRGTVFNERNVWTASGHGASAAEIAKSLVKNINMASATHELVATASGAIITFANNLNNFADYDIKVSTVDIGTPSEQYATKESSVILADYNKADSNSKPTANYIKHSSSPIGDVNYVKELAHKCIGDKGIGYTYVDAAVNTDHIYNNVAPANTAYDIVTLHFYNPRYDHNIDEHLFQTIHVAIPVANTAQFTNILKDVDSSNEQTDSKEPDA